MFWTGNLCTPGEENVDETKKTAGRNSFDTKKKRQTQRIGWIEWINDISSTMPMDQANDAAVMIHFARSNYFSTMLETTFDKMFQYTDSTVSAPTSTFFKFLARFSGNYQSYWFFLLPVR